MSMVAPHELVRLIGEVATVRLLVRLGGVEVYIPRHPTETSEVANVIGLPAAARLGEAMGPVRLELPKARGWCVDRIMTAITEGRISHRQGALLLDRTERWLRYRMAERRACGPSRGSNPHKMSAVSSDHYP